MLCAVLYTLDPMNYPPCFLFSTMTKRPLACNSAVCFLNSSQKSLPFAIAPAVQFVSKQGSSPQGMPRLTLCAPDSSCLQRCLVRIVDFSLICCTSTEHSFDFGVVEAVHGDMGLFDDGPRSGRWGRGLHQGFGGFARDAGRLWSKFSRSLDWLALRGLVFGTVLVLLLVRLLPGGEVSQLVLFRHCE